MRILVDNIPYRSTEADVRELFAVFGTVEAAEFVRDDRTGRFRGYAFIEMNDAAAVNAIEALDGMDVGGRNLRVMAAPENHPVYGRR